MRKVTANQVSNNWNGLLEVLEIKLVTRIPGQMSRGFGCSIVKMSQNLRRRWIEGSYVHEATSQGRNLYLIRVAILHVVISTRDESQASSVFNPKTQELDQQATCSNRCFDDCRVASGLGRRHILGKVSHGQTIWDANRKEIPDYLWLKRLWDPVAVDAA